MRFIGTVSLLLSFLLLAACAAETNAPDAGDTVTATQPAEAVTEYYAYPGGDYGGAQFRILALRTGYWGQDYDDLWVEKADGDVLNDAVYARNMETEEKLGVKITQETSADVSGIIRKCVNAGDNAYHIAQHSLISLITHAISNELVFIGDVPAMNLDAPWYDRNAVAGLSIANKLAVITGDIEVSDKISIMALVFNKKIAESMNIENIYGIINGGKWTLDKFYDIITGVTSDINGDGTLDKNDRWGFIVEDFGGWMLQASSGNRLAEKDENDIPYLTVDTERALNALDKIMKVMYEGNGRTGHLYTAEDFELMFMNDLAMFSYIAFSSVIPFRAMDSDFGIIPMPKYDEAQDKYYSATSPFVSRPICIPKSNTELEMTGAVLEVMSRESADTVKTAYYDKLLHGKLTRDNESSEMLDIIFGNILYDIGSTFNWGGIWVMYNSFFAERNTEFVSYYERIREKAQTELEAAVKVFTEN